jgi:hypothetical protein
MLFPASFCSASDPADDSLATGGQLNLLSGTAQWLNTGLAAQEPDRGACVGINFVDKNQRALLPAPLAAYGRRNPLVEPGDLLLQTPLQEVEQIPLNIRICPDDPAASQMVDEEFYAYQQFILGIPDRPVDVCFRLGEEVAFQLELENYLSTQLQARKSSATSSRDFLFTVLLHERFSSEFRVVQAALAESLTSLIQTESAMRSPRLVGAFVYSGSTDFTPNLAQRQSIIWCPQELALEISDPRFTLAEQNCTITPAVELDLEVINFVAPLGPFPSRKSYQEYLEEYGDKGLARDPRLVFYSVPIGPSTLVQEKSKVTYFDNVRYALGDKERARLCQNNPGSTDDPGNFYVRSAAWPEGIEGFRQNEINNVWLSDEAPGEYQIGLSWEMPFWGGIRYQAALTGTILSVAPFSRSASNYEQLADKKWQQQSWNFGAAVSHCRAYCDHPYFDESGTYQIQATWSDPLVSYCPRPSIPIWEGNP